MNSVDLKMRGTIFIKILEDKDREDIKRMWSWIKNLRLCKKNGRNEWRKKHWINLI